MSGPSSQLISSQIHPYVREWVLRVRRNGGGVPSSRTVVAANNFIKKCVSNGIYNKLYSVNIFPPDNNTLIFEVPLIHRAGSSTKWTNNNFVASDMTINGLKGNGSSKYFNSNILPNSFMTQSSAHICLYVSEGVIPVGTSHTEVGCASNSTTNIRFYAQYTSTDPKTYFFCFGDSANISATIANPPAWSGFLMGSKTATAAGGVQIYKANSSNAFASIASNGTTFSGTVPSALNLSVFATNEAGTPTNYSTKRLSFVSLGTGLTASESEALYIFVQRLRQELGGGFV